MTASPPDPAAPAARPRVDARSVVYEVYVRSFADSDGDGVGDLAGVTAHLDAVARLGVDAVWLTPFYPSPQADHGYDVADHRGVDPLFGDLAAFDALVERAHGLGLAVLVDVVPNHVSVAHPWFQQVLAAGPDDPSRARFHVRPGTGPDGRRPPNRWRSVFGGPAWSRLPDGSWYLHLFAPEQPDLDWTHPDVRADLERTLVFWAERGVDGFRVDVAGGLVKHPLLAEVRRGEPHPHWDRPEVHDVYRSWRRVLDGVRPGVFAVAEVWGPPERTAQYARPDELGHAFAFEVLQTPWSASALQRTVELQLAAHRDAGSLPGWVLGSHDFERVASRVGPERALALHLFLLAMPGSFTLYAGDELGLPQVDVPREAWQDPQALRSDGEQLSRDGARVPLPWTPDQPAFGFTTGTPWLPQPPGWGAYARSTQEQDPASPWSVLRHAIALRRTLWRESSATVRWIDPHPGVLVALRGEAVAVLNASNRPHRLALAGWQVVASSTGVLDQDVVPPGACVWCTVPPGVVAAGAGTVR